MRKPLLVHQFRAKAGRAKPAPPPGSAAPGHAGRRAGLRKDRPLAESAYVTHAELLLLAQRAHCKGIHAEPVLQLCRPEKNFWVFKATVFKSGKCRGFVGYGDAHPGNVSALIFNHAEMRMAETRAVNRALRKAYGIGLCSVEELPPWRLTPAQIASLGRTLKTQTAFPKGAHRAHKNQRPQSEYKTKPPRGGSIPRSRRQVSARGPRR